MNGRSLFMAAAACTALATTAPADAHHSFATEYDESRTIKVTGSVVKLEWTNPHARLYVEGEDETGKRQVWDFELIPPNALMRSGWRRDSLKVGAQVTVEGFRSKTSTVVAHVRTVKLADGQQILTYASSDPASPAR